MQTGPLHILTWPRLNTSMLSAVCQCRRPLWKSVLIQYCISDDDTESELNALLAYMQYECFLCVCNCYICASLASAALFCNFYSYSSIVQRFRNVESTTRRKYGMMLHHIIDVLHYLVRLRRARRWRQRTGDLLLKHFWYIQPTSSLFRFSSLPHSLAFWFHYYHE